jgi:hypothetical protein
MWAMRKKQYVLLGQHIWGNANTHCFFVVFMYEADKSCLFIVLMYNVFADSFHVTSFN